MSTDSSCIATIGVIDKVSYPKKPSVKPQRVNCGHMTSPKVTIHFWLITFDISKTQALTQHHCVSLINTDRMIWQHDLFGSGHDIDLRSNLRFDLLGHIIHHSTRRDELDAIVVKPLT